MPVFVECVENDITLGEICNTLRGVWGEYVAQGFRDKIKTIFFIVLQYNFGIHTGDAIYEHN